jgi:hypothetical protein
MKRIRDRQLRTSRALLVVTGTILLVGAAIAGLLAAKLVDRIGRPLDARTVLLNAHGRQLLHEHQLGFQLGALVVGIVLIVVGASWLRQQVPPMRRHEDTPLEISDAEVDGRNMIAGDALAHALESDLERSPHIARARAELQTGSEVVRLRLDIDEDTPMHEIITTVVDPAVARVVTVAELSTPPRVETEVRPVAVGVVLD